MRRFLGWTSLFVVLWAQTAGAQEAWAPFRTLVGAWRATRADSGQSWTVEREYAPVLNNAHLQFTEHAWPAGAKRPSHESPAAHWGLYSYDAAQNRITLREFAADGSVRDDVVESVAGDGGSLRLRTTGLVAGVEDDGMRRTVWFPNSDTLVETVERRSSEGAWSVVSETRFARKGRTPSRGSAAASDAGPAIR
jgi:hypothetical protein